MVLDPEKFGKQFYEQMESFFIEKMNEMIRDPSVLKHINEETQRNLDWKVKLGDTQKKILESMHIPTKDDVAKLLQYLQQIESKIVSLDEKLENLCDEVRKDGNSDLKPSKTRGSKRRKT